MKFKIGIILRVIYTTVWAIVWFTFGIFYKKQTRTGEQHFETPAPCIIIGNHPNTLIDVLIIAKEKKAYVYFLANAGLFSTKISNWILSQLYAIKIERPKDVKGRRIDNADSFKRSSDFLTRYGTLFIAAEGSSKLERRLRKIKTGAARIALDTMQRNDWTLPLTILTCGITYEKPKLAGHDMVYNYGEPINVKDYKEIYEKDTVKAVKKLTRDIQTKMQSLLLHTDPEDEDVDKTVQILEHIHKNEFGNDHAAQFPISKKWITQLVDMKTHQRETYDNIYTQVQDYCDTLKVNGLTDKAVQEKGSFFMQAIGRLLGFIPAVWGWINNLIAFYLPDFIVNKTGMYPGYTASIKLLLTVFLFPFTYWLQYKLIGKLDLGAWVPLTYIVSTIILGFFAIWYFRTRNNHIGRWRLGRLKSGNPTIYKEVKKQRLAITDHIFKQITS